MSPAKVNMGTRLSKWQWSTHTLFQNTHKYPCVLAKNGYDITKMANYVCGRSKKSGVLDTHKYPCVRKSQDTRIRNQENKFEIEHSISINIPINTYVLSRKS
jgi:hypothetical protein